MLYTVVLILMLVSLAGIIAYSGDVLGSTIGRHRLSLFGWRPRKTGQVVVVGAGILIMLTTMATLAVAFRGAAGTILNAERIDRELKLLQGQQSDLLTDIAALEEAIAERVAELERAQTTIQIIQLEREHAIVERDEATLERDALEEEIAVLAYERDSLRGELDVTEQALEQAQRERQQALETATAARDRQRDLELDAERLRGETQTLRSSLSNLQQRSDELQSLNSALEASQAELLMRVEAQAQQLSSLQERTRLVESGMIAFSYNEPVHTAVIAAQERSEIQAALRDMVEEANGIARQRRADGIALTTPQFLSLVDALEETPGEDFVAFLSRENQFQDFRVGVRIESRENLKLLARGQLLLSRNVHLGASSAPIGQEVLRNELRRLRNDADRELKRLGLFEFQAPQFNAASEEAFIAALRRLEGPVVIGLVAHAPTYVSGPAELEFVIVR